MDGSWFIWKLSDMNKNMIVKTVNNVLWIIVLWVKLWNIYVCVCLPPLYTCKLAAGEQGIYVVIHLND